MGWEQLEGTEDIIITKSMKDILTFKSFMNIDVIAPQSESSHLSQDRLNYIKQNYRNIYVVFDYDDAGIIAAERLEQEGFMIRWVSTKLDPNLGKPKDKDMSDYVVNHSIPEAVARMRKMFPELEADKFRDNRIKYFERLCKELREENL
jgi:5S rRNA maturation endonuclease (ribonuclease M5)